MTYFERALAFVLKNEGGYSNHPKDSGGETFRGISRNLWPEWPGWDVLDETRGPEGAAMMVDSPTMVPLVKRFYMAHFWGASGADSAADYKVARAVFDCSVLAGVSEAVRMVQRALNGFGQPLRVDGIAGSQTRAALREVSKRSAYPLLVTITVQFGHRLLRRTKAEPKNQVFFRGWMSRVGRLLVEPNEVSDLRLVVREEIERGLKGPFTLTLGSEGGYMNKTALFLRKRVTSAGRKVAHPTGLNWSRYPSIGVDHHPNATALARSCRVRDFSFPWHYRPRRHWQVPIARSHPERFLHR